MQQGGAPVVPGDRDVIAEAAPERACGDRDGSPRLRQPDDAPARLPRVALEAAARGQVRDGAGQGPRQQAVMEACERVIGVIVPDADVRGGQENAPIPVQVELVPRPGHQRRTAHGSAGLVQLPEDAERGVEDPRQGLSGQAQGHDPAARPHQPAFERVEQGLGCTRCWRRAVGDGVRNGLRLCRTGKAEAGRKGGGTAAKRLARGAEWAYVAGNTSSGDTMAEAAFNTIAEIQRLRDAGLPQEQAEAITLSIHSGVTGGVATKADLDLVRKDIELVHKDVDLVRKDVEALDAKIDASVKALDDKIDVSVKALDQKIDLVKETLETKIDKQGVAVGMQIANLQTEFANGIAEVAKGQAVQLRWIIGLLVTFFFGFCGLILAVLRTLAQTG